MPSPIAHIAAGFAISRMYQIAKPEDQDGIVEDAHHLDFAATGIIVFASMLPDADAILGILFSDFGAYHNQFTHSLFMGLVSAVICSTLLCLLSDRKFMQTLTMILSGYWIHVLLDSMTPGRGVMLLWPWSNNRFQTGWKFFYGVHWSEGWFSLHHLLTLFTEIIFGFFIFFAIRFIDFRMKGRG